ncbi:MAG: hypothetical protein KGL43_16650, partial [Burkholderiales bacterium]|nr:hypothetical protein [Burkholderiales bacterium]
TAAEYDHLNTVNQIAAERRFLKELVVVTGTAIKVSRTPDGQLPLLFLAGAGPDSAVMAILTPNAEERAAALLPPTPVRLVCIGSGRVETVSMLTMCSFTMSDAAARAVMARTVDEESIKTWSRARLEAWFKCPETFESEDDSVRAFGLSIDWLGAHQKPMTPASVKAFREQLLRDHHCAAADHQAPG